MHWKIFVNFLNVIDGWMCFVSGTVSSI